jgi:pectate lyase
MNRNKINRGARRTVRNRSQALAVVVLTALALGGRPAAALTPTGLFPANSAMAVCRDTPLRITFDSAPSRGTSGSIRIHRASDDALIKQIDASAATATKTIGGRADLIAYYPIILRGNTATIDPTNSLFAYNTTYYVQVDAGVFPGWGGIADTSSWRFTTRASAPSIGSTIAVNRDGSADFCTVQGAIDAVPSNNTTARTIAVAAGEYEELVVIYNKHTLTLAGASRESTTIRYANNSNLNPSTHRRFLCGLYANDITLRDLTLHNTTPYLGSQAEAIKSSGQRNVVRDCNVKSFQDTLLLDGRIYFWNCYVEGDVDYIWGGGTAYFDACELRAMHNGYLVQARNTTGPVSPDSGPYGFVFVDCALTAAPGVTSLWLNRINPNDYPYSNVALIDCTMGDFVNDAGWLLNNASSAPNAGFWEYRPVDPAGRPVDVSGRLADSRRLTAEEAANLRDVAHVLGGGDGWNPKITRAIDDTPIGYASVNALGQNGTTGGAGGTVVTVTNQADLEFYCGQSAPYIIQVQGTIAMTPYGKAAQVQSNKTIIGVGANPTIFNGGLSLTNRQNVIVRNLTIEDSYFMGDWDGKITDYDAIGLRGSHHVWIDHCHLSRAGDGLIDATLNCDYITISWCVLSYANKSMGLGQGDPQPERITVHHCWIVNDNQRNSRNERAWVHHFNNYWSGISFYCNNSKTNARVLIENSYFKQANNPHIEEEGPVRAEGNLYFETSGAADSTGTESTVPTPGYFYTMDPAGVAPATVVAGAGPFGGNVYSDNLTETIKVNFQPGGEVAMYGYLEDNGAAYGSRGGGFSYGWNTDNSANALWRENLGSNGTSLTPTEEDRRRNGMATFGDGTRTWEIALPDDLYDVFVACGDPFGATPSGSLPGGWSTVNLNNSIALEDTALNDPDDADIYDDYLTTVAVVDGRLTIAQAEGGTEARIAFIEIRPNHAEIDRNGIDGDHWLLTR